MKNILKSITAIVLATVMILSFASCVTIDPPLDTKEIVGDDSSDTIKIPDNTIEGSAETSTNKPADTSPTTTQSKPADTTPTPDTTQSKPAETQPPIIEQTTISETICFEYDGLTVTAKEIVEHTFWGTSLKLLVENHSNKDYTIGIEQVIVNNCMVSSLFSCSVSAGKKANDTLDLFSSDLEAAGIESIGQIEIYFYVSDPDTYKRVYESDCITIKTSLYDKMDTADSTGFTLYDEGGIKIVGQYLEESTIWGAAILLYIENNSKENITVSCNDLSINGYMVSEFFSQTVYAGKCAIGDISILSSDLEENDITTIEEVELKFRISNHDTYGTIAETGAIQFRIVY